MAIVNFPEFSVKIILSKSRSLVFTHINGLKKIRVSRTFTSDSTSPSYGIISQEGTVELFDAKGDIYNLIKQGTLAPEQQVEIYFADKMAGTYLIKELTENQSNLFSIVLKDSLLRWQEQVMEKQYNLTLNKTAKDFYNYLVNFGGLTVSIDETTDQHLESINIKYYYWEKSTYWEAWQKLCNLAQLYVYLEKDGSIIVISQKQINKLKFTKAISPTIINYDCISGQPQINRLTKQQIESASVSEKTIVGRGDLFGEVKSIVLLEDTEEIVAKQHKNSDIYYNTSTYNEIYNTSKNPYYGNTEIVSRPWGQGQNTASYYKTTLRFNISNHLILNPEQLNINCSFVIKGTTTINEGDSVFVYSPYQSQNKEVLIPYTSTSEMSERILIENKEISNGTLSFDLLLLKQLPSLESPLIPTFFPMTVSVQLHGQVYTVTAEDTQNNSDYLIDSNEFFTTDTDVGGIPIGEFNSVQVVNNFKRKQTCLANCALVSLKDTNNEVIYSYKDGEFLNVFDIVKFRKTDSSEEPEIWMVSKIEIDASGGRNFINIEAVEAGKVALNWEPIIWMGNINQDTLETGQNIWHVDDKTYYSDGSSHFRYEKTTSGNVWNPYNVWGGVSTFRGVDIWTLDNEVYLSQGLDHYVLDKAFDRWVPKEWSGLPSFNGYDIWHLDGDAYYSYQSQHYKLDKATNEWLEKEWYGLTNFWASNVWHLDGQTYHNDDYVLNKSTSTWEPKSWKGLAGSAGIMGENIWHLDGEVYHSAPFSQYVLNKNTNTWEQKEWSLYEPKWGHGVWRSRGELYYSDQESQYFLNKETME